MQPNQHIKPIGLTKNAGFQVGTRKTFPVSVETAWDFLISARGTSIWLGLINPDSLDVGTPFTTSNGVEGQIKVLKPYSHLRMKWKPSDWTNTSTLQIRVIPAKDKTTISFHQEKLLDEHQRNSMKSFWQSVLGKIEKLINQG
jgi:uncharacterized protein YndB with AHSA1/START domain